jgi:23S rRNA (cytidine1920-2'-O)/16S rRNA (cytidine1409-2'-O)-methyltransferase
VRDPEVHRRVLRSVCAAAAGWGAEVLGVVDSGLPGPKGNREFVVHMRESEQGAKPDDVDRWIDTAVG